MVAGALGGLHFWADTCKGSEVMHKPDDTDPNGLRSQILDAAESLIEGSNPKKIKVMAIARMLGVPHTTVYRYFDTKADLRNALSERRLEAVSATLAAVVSYDLPAEARLACWVDRLHELMKDLIAGDEEMFHTYHGLAVESQQVVSQHTQNLIGQLRQIIEDGVHEGVFVVSDPHSAATAVFSATIREHHPFFVMRRRMKMPLKQGFLALLMAGLRAGVV